MTMFFLSSICLSSSVSAEETVKPRIMILMDEKNVGGYSVHQAEIDLISFFTEKNYPVIDTELVKANLKRDQALQAMSGSNQAAASLGLQFGADVIIVGRAIAKGSATVLGKTNMRAYQATVTAKAIRTDTAGLIGTASGTGSKPHVDDTAGGSEAIAVATRQMIEKLFPLIEEKWGAQGTSENSIQLTISDVNQVWQLAALKRMLKEKTQKTSQVIQRSFVAGVASFELKTGSDSQTLAENLVMIQDEAIRLKVLGISANKIDAKLIMSDE